MAYNTACANFTTIYDNDLKDWENLTGKFAYLNGIHVPNTTGFTDDQIVAAYTDKNTWYVGNFMERNRYFLPNCSAISSVDTINSWCNKDIFGHFGADTSHGGYIYDDTDYLGINGGCSPWFYRYLCKPVLSQAIYDFKNFVPTNGNPKNLYNSLEPKKPCTQIEEIPPQTINIQCCIQNISDITSGKVTVENAKIDCTQKINQVISNVIITINYPQ